mmetsp:Transcript_14755/g.35171  ORF Transcript_14755/g.35171 Transcript_14755/m.35171 type:complete len:204 (-) Transcript_14755:119-730(-)
MRTEASQHTPTPTIDVHPQACSYAGTLHTHCRPRDTWQDAHGIKSQQHASSQPRSRAGVGPVWSATDEVLWENAGPPGSGSLRMASHWNTLCFISSTDRSWLQGLMTLSRKTPSSAAGIATGRGFPMLVFLRFRLDTPRRCRQQISSSMRPQRSLIEGSSSDLKHAPIRHSQAVSSESLRGQPMGAVSAVTIGNLSHTICRLC